MKKEYDFSKAEQGKLYRPDMVFEIPLNREAQEDSKDYASAVEVKAKTKKWTTNDDMKKKLGIA